MRRVEREGMMTTTTTRKATYRAAALLTLLLFAAALAACGRSEWQELAITDAGFSVLMRGQPYYARQQLETPAGTMYAHLYSSDRSDAYFAIGYSDFPLGLVVGAPPKQLFSGVRETWLRRIDGRIVASDESIRLAGKYPGMEFTGEGRIKDADAFVQVRLYLVDQRLYQLVAIGRKGAVSQGVVNRYLNSFRLIQQSEVGTLRVEPDGGK